MKKNVYKIKGLDCAACALELEEKISKIAGVESVAIMFMTEKMSIEINEENEEEIMKKVKKVIKKEEPDVELEKI